MNKILKIILILLQVNIVNCQTPSEDPSFARIFNDDFSGSTIDRTIWGVYNGLSWVPRFIDDPTTINVAGGNLNLIANYLPLNPNKFSSGAIRSINPFYIGTYFECKSKIPLGINAYPAFWVWDGIDCTSGNYREIDILEYWNYYRTSSANIHYCKCFGTVSDCRTSSEDYYSFANPNTYHTFSVFWNNNSIMHLLDNNPIIVKKNSFGALKDYTLPMFIENSLQITDLVDSTKDGIYNPLDITNPTNFPMTYQTDYIRAYRLIQDCNTDVTVIPNFFTYFYAVKRSIKLSASTIVPTSLSISLRAVEEIELQDGFEVPNGTTIYLNTNECY